MLNYISNSVEHNETIVFIHGIASTSETFINQIKLFKKDFTVIALDIPGYGKSPKIKNTTILNYASSIHKFLISKNIKKPVLIGHSLGGMIVQEIITKYTNFAKAAVLVGTTAKFGGHDLSWQNDFINSRLQPLENGQSMKDISIKAITNIIGSNKNQEVISFAGKIMSSIKKNTYKSAILSLVGFDLRHQLSNITIPTLLIAGEEDKQAPAKTMKSMSKKIKYAQYKEIKKCGHLIHLEKPEIFNKIIQDFILAL